MNNKQRAKIQLNCHSEEVKRLRNLKDSSTQASLSVGMTQYKVFIIFVGCILLFASICHAKVKVAIIATVYDDIITTIDLDNAMAEAKKTVPEFSEKNKEQLLDQLIQEKLLARKANELNVDVTPADIEYAISSYKTKSGIGTLDDASLDDLLKKQGGSLIEFKQNVRRQLMQYKIAQIVVRPRIVITEEDMRQYYTTHYQNEEYVSFHAIRIPLTRYDRCLSIEKNIHADDFKDAEKFEKMKISDLSTSFQSAIQRLKKGEVSRCIEMNNGYYILMIDDFTEGSGKSFDAVKNEIQTDMTNQKMESEFAVWMKELREKASVKIKKELL